MIKSCGGIFFESFNRLKFAKYKYEASILWNVVVKQNVLVPNAHFVKSQLSIFIRIFEL
jgi:hypothetical protein